MTVKIAVYTIFKNEQKFAERWLNSALDADYILAVDTGSTDATRLTLESAVVRSGRELWFNVVDCSILPFRFDEARNVSLHLLPADVDFCICLDMDEVLTPGWREKLEAHLASNPESTRVRYNYVWSWTAPGIPGLTYYAEKIHARAGYRWINPVHEILDRDRRLPPEVQSFLDATLIEHYPDNGKPRSQYLGLMELAVAEKPLDDRMAHYYGRELFYKDRYDEAIAQLQKHLALPTATWKEERAASCRYIADSFWALGEYHTAITWFMTALSECRDRETLVRLAQAHRALGNWQEVELFCEAALEIKERPNSYINEPAAWSDWPEKMLAEAREKKDPSKAPRPAWDTPRD